MPSATMKFMLIAALSVSLLTGCRPGPASETKPKPAAPLPAPKPKAETQPTPERFAQKALAESPGSWSAPAPAPPPTPAAASRAKFEKNPAAPDADQTLLDTAKHQLGSGNLTAAVRSLKRFQEKFPLSPLYPEGAFYLGLALQASGRHEEAWISLRSSLSGETRPERRALLEASLGEVYEARGDALSALLSYARAMRNDPEVFRKDVLIERIWALAKKIATHQLRSALEGFSDSPAGPYMQAALAVRAENEKRSEPPRVPDSGQVETDTPQNVARAPDAEVAVNSGRVGIMLPLSGPAAAAGERVYQGVQLALRHSLAKYPGLRIQLSVRDTKSTAQSAGQAAEVAAELIEKEKALALIGPLLTRAAESSAEVANRLQVPMLTPFSVRMEMNRDFAWVFRNSLTNRLQAQGVATYAIEHLGIRRFAVLHPENRDGNELTDAFTQAVANLGGEVVKIVSFPENATDFGAQMRALGGMDDRQLRRTKLSRGLGKSDPYQIRLNFDALFVPVHHDKAVLIAPQVPFYNMRDIRLLGGNGWNNRQLITRGERYVEGAVFVDGFFADSAEPKVARFVHAFRNIFGRTPGIFSALGYDAAQIIFAAVASGAKTRAEVRQYLAALKGFDGVMGLTDMGADNDAHRQLFVLSVSRKKIHHLQMVTPHRRFLHGAARPAWSDNAFLSPALKPAIQSSAAPNP